MFFRFLRRFGLVTHFGVGAHYGRQGYPREDHGIEVPLYGWAGQEALELPGAEHGASPDEPARAAHLHAIN